MIIMPLIHGLSIIFYRGGAKLSHNLWECACGEGHLSKKLETLGYDVTSTDIVYRGFGIGGVDFLEQEKVFDGDIITNPPFSKSLEFVEHALSLVNEGSRVFMLTGKIWCLRTASPICSSELPDAENLPFLKPLTE